MDPLNNSTINKRDVNHSMTLLWFYSSWLNIETAKLTCQFYLFKCVGTVCISTWLWTRWDIIKDSTKYTVSRAKRNKQQQNSKDRVNHCRHFGWLTVFLSRDKIGIGVDLKVIVTSVWHSTRCTYCGTVRNRKFKFYKYYGNLKQY